MNDTCGPCKFFVSKDESKGMCHFNPPSVFVVMAPQHGKPSLQVVGKQAAFEIGYVSITAWPDVEQATKACGSYEPKGASK